MLARVRRFPSCVLPLRALCATLPIEGVVFSSKPRHIRCGYNEGVRSYSYHKPNTSVTSRHCRARTFSATIENGKHASSSWSQVQARGVYTSPENILSAIDNKQEKTYVSVGSRFVAAAGSVSEFSIKCS